MLTHLLELRRRMLHVVIVFMILFLLFYYIAPNLFHALVFPLLTVLSAGDSLIATQITTPLFTPIKLATDAATLSTAPYVLFHAWRFAAPGLYRHERKGLGWAMSSSLLLFFIGILFGFYWVLPYMFGFFARAVPTGVRLMPDMGYAVDFITRMLLIFGLCFQIPLVCLVLVRLELIHVATLKMVRPYVIVFAFIVGMLFTPPDVLSQVMLAVPLCLLYEAGIFFARFLDPASKSWDVGLRTVKCQQPLDGGETDGL